MQQLSGSGGAAKDAAKQLLNYYRQLAQQKIGNYNETLEGISQIAPEVGKIYKQVVPQMAPDKAGSEGGIEPRKQGETISDYLKRTNK